MQVYSAAASRTKSHETNYIAPVRGKVSRNRVRMRFHLLDPPAAEEPPRLNCVKRKTQRKPYADNQDTHQPRSARDGFDTTSVFREFGSPKGLSVDRHRPRASEDQNQL